MASAISDIEGSGNQQGEGQAVGGLIKGPRDVFTPTGSVDTNADTFVTSSPVITSAMFESTRVDRRGGASARASSRRSNVTSSRVQREFERLQLDEETLKTRIKMNEDLLKLQDLQRHRMDLEDDNSDRASDDSSDNHEVNDRTRIWVQQHSQNVESPPRYNDYDLQLQKKMDDEETRLRNSSEHYGAKKQNTFIPRPPPPLHPIYEQQRQQFKRPSAPPPTPAADPISQLTEALKAVISQPQSQMERFMACQTMGKDLPQFDGNVEEWPAFISLFRTSTSECKISDAQNLVRLQKCLKSEAREVVRPLLVSPANVSEILKVLEKHFGQPNTIIRMLMQKARDTPVAMEDKPETLVKFAAVVRNLVKTITSLGKSKFLENPQLLEELVDKLPPSLRLEWAANMVNLRPAEADLSDFSGWLEKVSDAALLLNRSTLKEDSKEKVAAKDVKLIKGKGSQKKGETAMAVETKDLKSTCLFCEKPNHKTEECRGLLKLDPGERNDWVKKKNCCFSCLKLGHSFRKCRKKMSCGESGCTRLHHRILHFNVMEDKDSKPIKGEDSRKDGDKKKREEDSNSISSDPAVYLEIVPVVLYGPKGHVHDYAFCDKGSTATLIDDSIRKELGLTGNADPLTLRWLDGTTIDDNNSIRVSFGVKGKFEKKSYTVEAARTVKNLMLRIQSVNVKNLKSNWKHLQHVPINEMKNVRPRILIGADNIHLIVSREIREGPPNAPIASRNKLGWSIEGRRGLMKGRVDTNFIFCAAEKNSDHELHELVKKSFSLDALGITVSSNNLKSKQDARAEAMMSEVTRRVGDRYEVPLLWKEDEPCLPNNYYTALKRLQQIEKKMDRDPDFAREYMEKVEYYLDACYARKLTKQEAEIVTSKTWYLPHFFAYHPNKPGKPRFVFDAAAEHSGTSLNKNLVSGPDILKSLPGIIMKFREKKVAFTADIKEMFHQVAVRKEDQTAQRFLWRGMDRKKPPEQFVMQVMTFGATCSPYAAQFVKNLNALEHEDDYPAAVKSIVHHHYVDDLADGADSDEEALQLMKQIVLVHQEGGFSIVKWSCSSRFVMEEIPEPLRATDDKTLETKSELPVERVLGLIWNPNEDCFQFSMNFNKVEKDIISEARMPTKREVLKTVMSVFDPLGFISHFVIKAKILYQQIWKAKVDWDETIPEAQQKIWRKWIRQLPDVKNLKIPRHYFGGGPQKKLELHLFCDSSSEAYVSIAFIRWKSGDVFKVRMLCAKARVAPLKPVSIPRLELQSALIGVRLAEFIKEEQNLEISSTFYWTDAKTVILWLQSDVNRYKQYVAHRVGEILEKSNVGEWNWLPTKLNVADEATRSGPDIELNFETRWFQGPKFLQLPNSEWEWVQPQLKEDPVEMEAKKEFCGFLAPVKPAHHLPEISRFSSWTRLIRTTAWIRRFVQIKFKLCEIPKSGELTCKDLMWAQKEWWKRVQQECFSFEYAALLEGKPIPKESRILHLSPFMDNDGIIRVTSRIVHSPEMKMNQKQPIILDPSHSFVKLLIKQYHLWAAHQGQEYVINELRQRYWILRIRAAVKSVWNSCLECSHRKAKPVIAEMSPLPEFRVTKPIRAFTICGIDYFGPLTVTKFRRHEKKWVALFTCMHTRAVHLELVDSLSTDSVIMALVRMASVRGWPRTFHSDNGTNFRGASVELNKSLKELDQKKIVAELALKNVEWRFIPPSAPHFGGAWERLVRSVKKVLGVLLKEQAPKEELLRTMLAEATNIVNSRPLTYVPNDIGDPEVLTPNCFLFGTTSGAPILAKVEERDLCVRKQWKAAQRMADCFWKRWVKEYLPTLMRRTKWATSSQTVKKGDIVIIVDDNAPRNVWLKGIIVDTFPGRDGIIRVVDVLTKSGTFRRPVVKLCVLDGIIRDSVPNGSGTAEGSMLANADSTA